MNRITYILALYLMLILHACSPNELPEDFMEEPEYGLEGTLNGQDFFIDVGPDNVYINSESDTENGEIPSFTIEINGEECQECIGSLEFVISGEQAFNENLNFFDFIIEGNFDVIDPFIQEQESLIEISSDFSDLGELLIDDQFYDGSLLELEPGEHFLSLNLLEIVEPPLGFIYESSFEVNSTGGVCFEQTTITFEDEQLQIQVPEEFQDDVEFIQLGQATLEYDGGLTINPIDFLLGEGFSQILSIEIVYSEGNGCMFSEQFNWLGELFDFSASSIGLTNIPYASSLSPNTVSLVYTNFDGVVYSSLDLGNQDWFEIIDIELAEGSEDSIFNITFSCTIGLVNAEDPSDIITLQLENAVIPLVFE